MENEELKEKFKEFLHKYKYPIIAHNARFDRKFLLYWGWVEEKQEFICSRDNIKKKEQLDNYKLEYLLSYYGINKKQEHNAMQDILDLLEVLKKAKIEKWIILNEKERNSSLKDTYFAKINKILKQYDYLTEDIETDVIIIGGGVTGSILGYYFSKKNIDTVIILWSIYFNSRQLGFYRKGS